MRRLTFIFAAVVATLQLAPPCWGQDSKTRAQERKEAKANADAAKKQARLAAKTDFSREFKALEESALLLADVRDEREAKRVAAKLCSKFDMLPPPMGGTEEMLETWARKANLLNREMERLRKERWFVSSGLQKAWTLATDPFSRRRAEKK